MRQTDLPKSTFDPPEAGCLPSGIGVRCGAGRRYRSGQAGDVLARPRCPARNSLSTPIQRMVRWSPELACSVFSLEAKASNNARADWRSTCSSSHASRNWIGTVIRRRLDQCLVHEEPATAF